jgi:hypothetical protein
MYELVNNLPSVINSVTNLSNCNSDLFSPRTLFFNKEKKWEYEKDVLLGLVEASKDIKLGEIESSKQIHLAQVEADRQIRLATITAKQEANALSHQSIKAAFVEMEYLRRDGLLTEEMVMQILESVNSANHQYAELNDDTSHL